MGVCPALTSYDSVAYIRVSLNAPGKSQDAVRVDLCSEVTSHSVILMSEAAIGVGAVSAAVPKFNTSTSAVLN